MPNSYRDKDYTEIMVKLILCINKKKSKLTESVKKALIVYYKCNTEQIKTCPICI